MSPKKYLAIGTLALLGLGCTTAPAFASEGHDATRPAVHDTATPGGNDDQQSGDDNDAQQPGDDNGAQQPGDDNGAQQPGDDNGADQNGAPVAKKPGPEKHHGVRHAEKGHHGAKHVDTKKHAPKPVAVKTSHQGVRVGKLSFGVALTVKGSTSSLAITSGKTALATGINLGNVKNKLVYSWIVKHHTYKSFAALRSALNKQFPGVVDKLT